MSRISLISSTERAPPPMDFTAGIREFDGFERRTAVKKVEDIDYFTNEFWTSGQRQSHPIHEISYRACFKAQLPEFFIERLTRPGDVVYDPFMGRGTTPIQAALMGRRAYGNDINPLSVLLTRPRLSPIVFADVAGALKTVDWTRGEIQDEDLLAFYHPKTLQKLEALRAWLAIHAPLEEGAINPVADWIRMVAINRLSGHSPGFFSGRSMPPNQAVSIKAQRKINQKLGITPPEKDVPQLILKKTKSLLRNGSVSQMAGHCLLTERAWHTPEIESGSVDLVITSPPFLDIVQYATDNWLRCWFAGIDAKRVAIDMHRTEEAWTTMIASVLKEQARILRPDGYIAFEVGEVRGGKILLEKLVCHATQGLPFKKIGVMINQQQFTKTSNCWGVANGSKGTNTNRIVLLQRK